jgi:hypothetical protein
MKYLYFYFHHDSELALLLCENVCVLFYLRGVFVSILEGRFPAVVFAGTIIF